MSDYINKSDIIKWHVSVKKVGFERFEWMTFLPYLIMGEKMSNRGSKSDPDLVSETLSKNNLKPVNLKSSKFWFLTRLIT